MNKGLDQLVNEAIYLCKSYDQVSPYLFQRRQSLDLDTAEKVFAELEKIGLVVNIRPQEDDQNAIIANVNKEKLKELQTN